MNKIYCLTCNNNPVITSHDVERLKERQKFLLNTIAEDNTIKVLHRDENAITYHTGISYETDEFEIVELEII